MTKKLDLTIVDAIRSIVENADCEVIYTIHKGNDKIHRLENWRIKKVAKEVINVNITLVKWTE